MLPEAFQVTGSNHGSNRGGNRGGGHGEYGMYAEVAAAMLCTDRKTRPCRQRRSPARAVGGVYGYGGGGYGYDGGVYFR